MTVIFLPPPPIPPFYFTRLSKKCGTIYTFEYILIPDVEEGPNILTAVPRWKSERGGGSMYHDRDIPIPFLLNFKKRELFLGWSFWNPFLQLNVFTPKHNFVRIQKYIFGRFILTSLFIFHFSCFLFWGLGGWNIGIKIFKVYSILDKVIHFLKGGGVKMSQPWNTSPLLIVQSQGICIFLADILIIKYIHWHSYFQHQWKMERGG